MPHARNIAYCASIMFDAFYAYFGQNYASIIGANLIPMPSPLAPHTILFLYCHSFKILLCWWLSLMPTIHMFADKQV